MLSSAGNMAEAPYVIIDRMIPRKKIFTLLLVLSLLGGTFAGFVENSAHAAPPASPAQDALVISEFRTRGLRSIYDEFVEIFNPSTVYLDIGGIQLYVSDQDGAISLRYTVPGGISLAPGGHYLVANGRSDGYSGVVPPNGTYTTGIPDNGGIALVKPGATPLDDGAVIDQVGMNVGSAFKEGALLFPLTGASNTGYERKPGGFLGSCFDSDDNYFDFGDLPVPSDPQNLLSAVTPCAPATETPTWTPTITFTFTPSDTPSPTTTGTPTVTASPTSTSAFTATFTRTATSTPTRTPLPPHIVISEFRPRGINGAGDEFVELYNPTGGAVNISGWELKRSSGCSDTVYSLVTIKAGVVLQPGQHYLLVSNFNASLSGADQTFTPGIVNTGGIALYSPASSLPLDQVGMCADTEFVEGNFLPPIEDDLNRSYERKPGGNTSCVDTNNNAADFQLLTSSNPQNLSSPAVVCAGISTYTPTLARTTTLTRTLTATRTPTAAPTAYPGSVVINEFLPRPGSDWNGDGEANSRDEYIELINMGSAEIDIRNWVLDDLPQGGSSPFTLPSLTLAPYQIVRFYASETGLSLSDGGDTVLLRKPDGRTADIKDYPVVTASDRSWCRLPDGSGAWAFICRPTPGRLNLRAADSSPGSGEVQPEVQSECPLPDTIPQAFWMAECSSPGAQIWRRSLTREFWLERRWKWDVFVE